MRSLIPALLTCLLFGCGGSAEPEVPPPAIPKDPPAWSIVKKKVTIEEREVAVLEITDHTIPEVTKSDREHHLYALKIPFRELAAVGWNRPYGFAEMKALEGPAKNVWYVVIGPPDAATDGIMRVDLWPKERYAALVELSTDQPDSMKGWHRPPALIVKHLNSKRELTISTEYRTEAKKFLLMMSQ